MRTDKKTIAYTAVWIVGAIIAVFFATIHFESAFVDGEYIPRTNDSFYHARRILDAAIGDGFYEFDPRMHVPNGSWISWPWGYDFLTAQALHFAMWLQPATDAMGFISYVPVTFMVINSALFVAALAQAGLRPSLTLLALLALAMLPVSQLMHSIGMIDHHFLEFTFILLAVWLGMRWLAEPADRRRAAALGVALGAAVAFHNGLFAIQIPLIGSVFILWLRNRTPDSVAVGWLVGALLISTLAAALPSVPLREFVFEFALLSWFHVYIAFCTGSVLLIMSRTTYSVKSLASLAAVSAGLAIPILFQALRGASFVTGEMSHLDTIAEVRSPFTMFIESWGPYGTATFYSWLIVAAPALLAFYAWRCLRESSPKAVYFSVWAVFGLALLLTQYRLHYFGIFFLLGGTCLLLQEVSDRYHWREGLAVLVALGAIALTFQPPLKDRLFIVYAPAADDDYAYARDIYTALKPLCESDPGLVLASSDDGSPILFHTECSVISNNFIMRPADEVALNQIFQLMQSSPQAILEYAPEIKYVFLRAVDFALPNQLEGVISIDQRSAVGRELLGNDEPPPGYESVHSVYRANKPGDPVYLFARLLKINRSDSE